MTLIHAEFFPFLPRIFGVYAHLSSALWIFSTAPQPPSLLILSEIVGAGQT